MGKKIKDLEDKHCQKLLHLFKGKLSISDRSYYQNLARLDNLIANVKKEIKSNCYDLTSQQKMAYFEFLLETIGIPISGYNQSIFKLKLEKYNVEENSFPKFQDEELNQLLNMVPDKPIIDPTSEELARQRMVILLQEIFFRHWMSIQKKELENWLKKHFEIIPVAEEPEKDTLTPLGTLYRKIAYCDKRALIAAIEEAGGDVEKELAELFGRPKNKVQLQLAKLSKRSSEIAPNSRQDKDNKMVDDFIDFGRGRR